MPEYRVTFGQQYPREDHPRLPQIAHHDGWLTIIADTYDDARDLTLRLCGQHWSMLYDSTEHAGMDLLYPLGELLRVIDPKMQGPVVLVQTPPEVPTSGFLVTLWADGTGELAARDVQRWLPPVPLQPAP